MAIAWKTPAVEVDGLANVVSFDEELLRLLLELEEDLAIPFKAVLDVVFFDVLDVIFLDVLDILIPARTLREVELVLDLVSVAIVEEVDRRR